MGDITARYLEQARGVLIKQTGEKVTDYKLAKALKITPMAISKYLKSDRECDNDEIIYRIAQIAQVPALEIIAKIHEKKAETPETKALWASLLSSKNRKDYILCSIQNYFRLMGILPNPPSNSGCILA